MKPKEAQVTQPALLPQSIIRSLWKHRLLISAGWLLGTAAAVVIIVNLQPVYSADSLILVEAQKIPETFVAATVQVPLQARLDTLKQRVLSGERLWSLIETLNLYPDFRRTHTREEVLLRMRKDILISLERGWSTEQPGAFRIVYEAHDPKTAAEVTNRMARFFISENLREREIEAAGTSQFLEAQLAESKRLLEEQETRLKDFKLSFNGELPEQETALLASMAQERTELLGLQEAIARAQQSKTVLENTLAAARDNLKLRQAVARRRSEEDKARDAAAAAQAQPANAPTDLDRARAQLHALQMRYEDGHPDVQRLMAEIAQIERRERDLKRTAAAQPPAVDKTPPDESIIGENERIAGLEAQAAEVNKEIENLEAQRRRLVQDASGLQDRIHKLPIREQQLAVITRDYETCKTNYKSLLDKKLAADVAANMERRQKAEKFVMLDPARVPEKPVRPNRWLWSAAAALFSLLAAAALAFLLEWNNDVVLGEWELPAGTRVIGRLPRMEISRGGAAR